MAYPNYLQKPLPFSTKSDIFKKKPISVKHVLQPVDREDSNLEAENGETAVVSDGSGLPSQFRIAGKSHAQGGTPLNLPPNSFIFSKDHSMKIRDEKILAMFGMAAKKSGYTPAEIAKKYDINNYRKILADKNTDKLQRDSAESMITNYNEKLAQLALVQESHKGFPTGIPMIAMPYLQTSGLDPAQLMQQQTSDESGDQENMSEEQARYGGNIVPEMYTWGSHKFGGQTKFNYFKKGGEFKAPSSNKGMVSIQYASPLTKEGINIDEDHDDVEVLHRVKIVKPGAGIFQKGGEPKKKGTPTYDPTEKSILKRLFPNVVLPEDVVEAKQKKSGVGYGRFDKAAADKNWAWYGKPIDWNNSKEVGEVQKAYNDRIYSKLIAAGHPVDAAQKMVERIGFDPKAKGQPNALDNNAGKYTETRVDINPMAADKAAEVIAPEVAEQKKLGALPINHVQGDNSQAPADFWLQDIVKTAGAVGDRYRINKYLPWQGTYNPYLPQTTFYDPTRELAQNAELANISSQTAGMFGTPGQLAANLSSIQGQAAGNAANILGKYNNLNVSASNQNEQQRTQTLNDAGMYNANQATNLYDKTTIANQQFDNSKAMARQNIRQSFLDALTNRAQTQSLNNLYPQYRVNPITGGTTEFTGKDRAIKPENSDDDVLFKKVESATRRFPGTTPQDWLKVYTGK